MCRLSPAINRTLQIKKFKHSYKCGCSWLGLPPAPQLMGQGVPFLGASVIQSWEPEGSEGEWVQVAVKQRSGSWTSRP